MFISKSIYIYIKTKTMEENKEIPKDVLELARQIESLGLIDTAGYKNLLAIKEYTTSTRDMFRALQKENQIYKNQVLEQGKIIELLKTQMSTLQIKVYSTHATN